MEVHELPASETIVATNAEKALENALAGALGPEYRTFSFFDVVKGSSCSGRIFYAEPHDGAVSLPCPMTPRQMAKELGRLSLESRYDPQEAPISDAKKGWEVRRTLIAGKQAAVVWAAWVT